MRFVTRPLIVTSAVTMAVAVAVPGGASHALASSSGEGKVRVASMSGVLTRAMAQQGLAIGMASNVLQGNLLLAEFADPGESGEKFNTCFALSRFDDGAGGIEILRRTDVSGTEDKATVRVYYDASCAKPYITQVTTATSSDQAGKDTENVTSAWTYQGPGGARLGVFDEKASAVDTDAGVQLIGVGTFTAKGSHSPVSLGLSCFVPHPQNGATSATEHCTGGIAQHLADIKRNLGSLTPLTLTVAFDKAGGFGKVTFTGTGAGLRSGTKPLRVGVSKAGALKMSGSSSTIGSDTTKGAAAKFALFTPAPTGWAITDTKKHTSFAINVKGSALKLTGTVTDTKSRQRLATLHVDRSGTGTIRYAGQKKSARVVSWLLTG